ncbi:MAG: hypothetical protein ACOY41_00130 [Pseudomonadota bacterium]
MNDPYQFADLARINRWVGWLLLPPLLTTVAGMLHALYSYALLAGLQPALPLFTLDPGLRRTLQHDDLLRLTQISLTVLFILFFCVVWLYLAFRNLIALFGERQRSMRSALAIHWDIWSNLAFARRLLQRLWRESTPDSHAHLAERWLVPWWWTLLIFASLCKLAALVTLHDPQTVGAWREGLHWMLAAYFLYFALFVLTWRLVKQLETLQGLHWRRLSSRV